MEQAITPEAAKRDTRFKPGQSGNPRGSISRKARHAEMTAQLASDLGGVEALTPGDQVLLRRAVDLLLTRSFTIEDQTRLTNAAMRIVNGIRRRTASARKSVDGDPAEPLRDYLAKARP